MKISERPVLPYPEIKAELFPLLDAAEQAIHVDERPRLVALHAAMPTVLKMAVRSARETWNVIDLVASKRGFEAGARWESAVALPPMVRTFVDGACATTFLFEAPADRMVWYLKSTWREMNAKVTNLRTRHGAAPDWTQWLTNMQLEVDGWEPLAQITADEKRTPGSIKWWPNPGKMPALASDTARKARLQALHAAFYGDLSGAAHLSGTGALMQGGALQPEARKEMKEKYLSDQLMTGLSALFAWMSELVIEAAPALRPRMLALWEKLVPMWLESKDLFDDHYASRLGRSVGGA